MKRAFTVFAAVLLMLLQVSCTDGKVNDDFSVYGFSAGAADAFLIKTGNSAVLIDTAESDFGDDIVDYIVNSGTNRLDCLVITHFDKDHVGGAAKILEKIPVDKVFQTEYPGDTKAYKKYLSALSSAGIEPVTLKEQYSFSLDGAQYRILPPEKEIYKKDTANNSSLIVSVKYGERSFLFCGDAENERLSEFVAANVEHYDFIKMPHHGRWSKQLTALIADTLPKYSVITSSDSEPEEKKTEELLRKFGVQSFLTRKGDVRIVSDGKNIAADYVEK